MAENLNQYSNDYMAEINRRKAINPNDPTIAELNTMRDQKIQGMYGDDYQAEINRRQSINPNDPMINDLTRLRQTKIKNSPQVYNSLPVSEQFQNYNLSPSNQRLEGILTKLEQRLNTPFQYDSNQDTGLKQDQDQAMGAVREQMGNRGMLYSDATKSLMTQEATKLIPQYRQIAYGQYQDETKRMMDFAGFVSGMDKDNYNRLKDLIDYDNKQKAFAYEKEQNAIENERKRIKDAWERVEAVGMVDNVTSKILDLHVGTPSLRARETIQKRLWEVQDRERQIQATAARDVQNFNQQVQIMEMKEKSETRKKETVETYNYNFAQAKAQFAKMDPEETLALLNSNPDFYIEQIGSQNFSKLVDSLEAKIEKKNKGKNSLEGLLSD